MSVAVPVAAQEQLPEQVLMLKKPGLFGLELEVTVFRPPGEGPFPIVLINHGKEAGDTRFQGRARYPLAARFFLARGYVVVIPMRKGFSKSSGSYIGGGCNVESNGVQQAEDVKATLDHFTRQPWVDPERILVIGQSHGGLTTLAFGALNYPGVKGLINFAGGLRQDSCPGWESTLARAFGSYARQTRVDSLWFYGDNDSYWSRPVWEDMHARYVAGLQASDPSAQARMVAFGTYPGDAHSMFGQRAGEAIWQAPVLDFMRLKGLPHVTRFAQFQNAPRSVWQASGFAAIDQVASVPFLSDSGRKGYQAFLARAAPRAFAVSPNGAWGSYHGSDDDAARALANCNRHAAQKDCKVYAVDDQVVWKPD